MQMQIPFGMTTRKATATATATAMVEGGDGWFVFGEIPSKTYGEDTDQDRDLSGELICNLISDRG